MYNERGEFTASKWLTRLVALLVIVVVLVFASVTTVPAGYRAILMQGGKPVGTFDPGFNFKLPFFQSTERMDVQVQKIESAESTGTSDLQSVTTTIALNYRLNPDTVIKTFERFRHDYENRVVKPAIEESLKATTALFTAEELITHRSQVKDTLDEVLKERLEDIEGTQYFIFVTASLTDFSFNPDFQTAIESKVEAQQKALEAENYLRQVEAEAQQMVIKALAKKDADVAEAEGEAMARMIQANASAISNKLLADARAYEIQLINEKIADNPNYLTWTWIQAWDGKLPQTVFGDENIELLLQGGIPSD